MEKRTNSPYPRIDRLIMAGIGVVLVAGTVLFIWSDRAHDWRYYQIAASRATRRPPTRDLRPPTSRTARILRSR